MRVWLHSRREGFRLRFAGVLCAVFVLGVGACLAQDAALDAGLDVEGAQANTANAQQPPVAATPQNQLAVNWLYGAYVPKDAPLVALTGEERWKLFVRQSFTTPGIYVKTAFFTVHDQVRNTPPEWGDGAEGFGKRLGTRQAQFLMQNAFTSLGNAAVGWEPRYDRCRCVGFWPRTRHAIVRNFVTYDNTEKHLRPQLMPYAGSFGAGVITATWYPENTEIWVKGYQSVLTQVWVGALINELGEFAPDVMAKLKKKKD